MLLLYLDKGIATLFLVGPSTPLELSNFLYVSSNVFKDEDVENIKLNQGNQFQRQFTLSMESVSKSLQMPIGLWVIGYIRINLAFIPS